MSTPETDIQVEGDVFDKVDLSTPDVHNMDLDNLVSNSHIKHDKGAFVLHPGDKVPRHFIDEILNDARMGEETLAEMLRTKTFVHKSEYRPSKDTRDMAVEQYQQPVFTNQNHEDGEKPEPMKDQETPTKPAESKSNTTKAGEPKPPVSKTS